MNGFPSQASQRNGSAYATGNTGSRSNNNGGPYSNISGNAGIAPSTSTSGKSDDLTLASPCLFAQALTVDRLGLHSRLRLAECSVESRVFGTAMVQVLHSCAMLACPVLWFAGLCCGLLA